MNGGATSTVAERTGRELYLSDFSELGEIRAGRDLRWLQELRRTAIDRFAELDFPTTRHEDWKYTNVAPLSRIPFRPAEIGNGRGAARAAAEWQGQVPFAGLGFAQLVFVDGRFAPELSRLQGLPATVEVRSLREVLAAHPGHIEEHLGRHADHRRQAFVALNTAFFDDGAFIRLPGSTAVNEPIHLVFLSTGRGGPIVTHPRNLILAGPESQATIIEHYLSVPEGAGASEVARAVASTVTSDVANAAAPVYFTNAVTEIVTGAGAALVHYRIQEESEAAYHLGTVAIHQERDSHFGSHSLSRGARLGRIEVSALIAGAGADCVLNGLYLAHGRQHIDHHTLIDHAVPHGSSRELFKGILDGAARGVFTGRIIVRENAAKTSAHQTNRNLLLSDEALADTRPQLEIRNNDVACTHGATIGQLDEEHVFYLRSRGIGAPEARRLLTYAFASEILSSLKVEALRTAMEGNLESWFAGGQSSAPAGGAKP